MGLSPFTFPILLLGYEDNDFLEYKKYIHLDVALLLEHVEVPETPSSPGSFEVPCSVSPS